MRCKKDTLGFQIKMSDKPVTRLGLLAVLSSVYNPLGSGAPFFIVRWSIHTQFLQEQSSPG